ncbi:MAG: metallophosphoesterase family protein [Vicinamibacterales bacterium]
MRVAALYDIHGNLPALEAVLDEVHAAAVDLMVIGGDILPGPMARDVLLVLQAIDPPAHFIRGNCERAMLDERAAPGSATVPEHVRAALRWTAAQFSADELTEIASWPATLHVDIPHLGDVLFCHATPRDDNEIFTKLTPEIRVAPAFAGSASPIVVCGHTHMPFDRRIGSVRVVNAGSVGMPYGDPGAYWLLLGPNLEFRRTRYDLARAAARIRATTYPQADEFADRSVLQPPSEARMLEVFRGADAH